MKPITDYQIVNLFSTRGAIPTGFRDVATGHGVNRADAVRSALEYLAKNGWEVNGMSVRIMSEVENARGDDNASSAYHFISVYVR